MDFRRLYVFEEDFRCLRLAKARYKQDMSKLANEAITSLFDEKGQRKKAVLKEETLHPLLEWANELKISPDELITMIVSWGRVFSDPRLSVMDAMKSIPELARELGIPRTKKPEKS